MATFYNVVFEGKILPGKDLGEVKKALAGVLNKDAGTVAQLFSGRPVVLRKAVDAATGEKFQKNFRAAGAICALKPLEGPPEPGGGSAEIQAPALAAVSEPKAPVPKKRPLPGGKIILSNIETVPGLAIVEHFGLVSGSTVRAKHVGKDLLASFKNIVGGELKAYTELLQESREEATQRMTEQARQLGANAVVNVRYSTSSVSSGAAELYAYGTAVRVE
jgi:uncharacterized protein YbjQ (UPF0145 family)